MCDVVQEEVIPVNSFLATMATKYPSWGSDYPGMNLKCSNWALVQALEEHLNVPAAPDGSDTRSIACQVRVFFLFVVVFVFLFSVYTMNIFGSQFPLKNTSYILFSNTQHIILFIYF